LCPAAALAAVAAGSNVAARGLIPVWVLEQSAETASQARHPAAGRLPGGCVVEEDEDFLDELEKELRELSETEQRLRREGAMMVIEKLRSNEGLGGRLGSMGASGGAMQSFREDPLHAKSHFSTCSTGLGGEGDGDKGGGQECHGKRLHHGDVLF
jgi:hypothetical protein